MADRAHITFAFDARLLEAAEIAGRGVLTLRPEGMRAIRLPLGDEAVRLELAGPRFSLARVRVTVAISPEETEP
jgi:hypothetical protein